MKNLPRLTPEQKKEISDTIIAWAKLHPRPEESVIGFWPSGSNWTPRKMADAALYPDTPEGQRLYRIFAIGLIQDALDPDITLDEILGDFRRDIRQWAPQRSRRKSGPNSNKKAPPR